MRTNHKIIFGDSRWMEELEDNSVQLAVTSPPYWQLKDYENENQIGFNDSYPEYIRKLNQVWTECYRVLEPGCKLCINIGDQFTRTELYGRYKIIPIRTEFIKFCESIGFDYLGAIIWEKLTTCNSSGGASIMGSYPYPRNGIIKMDYEFILIFKKLGKEKPLDKERKAQSALSNEEWKQYFTGHWNFPGERQNGHIAMFPLELPRRLIKMYTLVGDTVLDPFLGSGTTTAAAIELGRNSVGYEIDPAHRATIEEKIGMGSMFNPFDAAFVERKLPDRPEEGLDFASLQASIGELRQKTASQSSDDTLIRIFEGLEAKASLLHELSHKGIKISIEMLDSIIAELGILKEVFSRQGKIRRAIEDIQWNIQRKKYLYYYTYENITRINRNYGEYKSVVKKEDKKEKIVPLIRVRQISDANKLVLEDGRTVLLKGTMPFEENREAAVSFLQENILNKKVELSFDKNEDPSSFPKEVRAYVKMKDKTHINAKMIKEGLLRADPKTAGRFKKRFAEYEEEAKVQGRGCWNM